MTYSDYNHKDVASYGFNVAAITAELTENYVKSEISGEKNSLAHRLSTNEKEFLTWMDFIEFCREVTVLFTVWEDYIRAMEDEDFFEGVTAEVEKFCKVLESGGEHPILESVYRIPRYGKELLEHHGEE